ncbi:putative sulfate exporter family transporter [Paucibacter sp. PLA-PC-4]|uniref:YeiH family protein n=1 Tax=Paucibacter sp. PLA-PC-4 TaxID=2993655 RepID=UPI00224A4D60|nr:putative sulfate exporter family transporter [Paucibacter sp. PLA-PC-4]MCX2863714.1 putative sulfate exporter family transporter [Paucibacter sp. PLA-PC-4]
MSQLTLVFNSVTRKWQGTVVCVTIALAATFVSQHYGGPQLLYALLMGVAFHFLHGNPQIGAGVDFCGRTVLRVGVALLGARITTDQVAELGARTATIVTLGLALTIACGLLLARMLGRRREEGLLTGGAVAICGASAAMAISAVLPQSRENERITLFTVVGVTVFSTIAMVLYPLLSHLLALSPLLSGIFLGGTIHDVAQVVAAGMLLGPQAADTATVVKLFRVLLLVPVVLVISIALQRVRSRGTDASLGSARAAKVPMVPTFLIAFVALVIVSSTGVIPAVAVSAASDASRWLLVIAIAAAGVKTSFEDLLQLGWQPVLMLLVETLFIAGFVLTALLVT